MIMLLGFFVWLVGWFWVFCFVWPPHVACGILIPRPGIKPMLPAVEAWSPNHWTAREFPCIFLRLENHTKILTGKLYDFWNFL